MIRTLTATTTDAITSALVSLEAGVGAARVLTLVIATDAAGLEDALAAAHGASRDHPSRVVAVVVPSPHATGATGDAGAQATSRLDAQIRSGQDTGAGETLVLLPAGAAATHLDTLVVPFLLPDVPVVTWWPTTPPARPSTDPLGRLASVRITNTPALADPAAALAALAPGYARGDIDLAWTRITLWRAVVASMLSPVFPDQEREQGPASSTAVSTAVSPVPGTGDASADGSEPAWPVLAAQVHGEACNASLGLMVAWLSSRLACPVQLVDEDGAQGITAIEVTCADGTYRVERCDAERVTVRTPASDQARLVTMPRREPVSTLNEELRRLAPDLVYEEVLAVFASQRGCRVLGRSR